MTVTVNLTETQEKAFQTFAQTKGISIEELIQNIVSQYFLEEEPNQTTLDAMKDAENDENMYGPFDSISELMEALNAET